MEQFEPFVLIGVSLIVILLVTKKQRSRRRRPRVSYIYTLKCPVSKQIRYVGKANNPAARFQQHLRAANPEGLPVYQWIYWLKMQQLEPELRVVDKASPRRIFELEKQWIEYGLKQGYPLLNVVHNKRVIKRRSKNKKPA